ncbi:MAG TPA: hypothetical protein VN088_08460 [Nocardioides sp.]|nr:hypothetical protein [Nocardioides sp.]
MLSEQFRFLAAHYLVRGAAKVGDLGTAFVYRRSQVVAPQKAGKSPLEAAQVCLESVGPALFAGWAAGGELYDCRDHGCGCGFVYDYVPGEPMGRAWPTPLIQITASSVEQTENIYDALRPMIELGPLADLIPKTGEEFIRLPNGGRIDVVTSSAKSRLGQRVTFVPQDETGIWTPQTGMVKVAETQRRGLAGMGGRAVEITNAWDPSEDSVAQRTAESRQPDIYRQHVQAPANLSYRDKRERHRIHTIVYKGWWGERNLASIEAEAAELLEKDPAQAERFFGNRVVHGLGSWMVEGLWASREADRPIGPAICLGFDGSESGDWTAIRAETFDGHRFTPTYGPDRRPTIWNPAEWGGTIPRGEVHAAVDEICAKFRVARAYCDPKGWQSEIGDWALRYGDDVFVEWATYRIVQMHAALERSMTDLISGRSTHDSCPITATHVANARKIAKPGDRYILGKPADHQKIDATMADTLAHEAAADARAAGWTGEDSVTYGWASA